MPKQKRMVYLYEENLAFYDSLTNKSQFVNDALQDARINKRIKHDTPVSARQATTPEGINHPDPRIADTYKQLADMEKRDRS